MFWLGFIIIFIFAIGLTEILLFLLKPFITMSRFKKKNKKYAKIRSKERMQTEVLEDDAKEDEYYAVPVMVSSYTVDLSGVLNKIQKINAEDIEILDMDEKVDKNRTEELI